MSDLLTLIDLTAEYRGTEGVTLEWEKAYSSLFEMIANPQQWRIWLLQSGKTPAGFLVVQVIQKPDAQMPHAIIDEFFVLPQFRSPEVLAKVTDFTIKSCRALGICALHQRFGRQWYVMTTWL